MSLPAFAANDKWRRRTYAAAKISGGGSVKFYSFWRSLASFRVRIALNIKQIVPDEVVNVDLMKGEQRQDEYKRVNPQMLLPALLDGDGPILFQSIAIMEYLDETHPHPRLLPADARGRARVRALALINAADSHPLMVPRVRNFMEHELKLDEAAREKWIRHWIGEGLAAMEAHLARDKETGAFAHGDSVTMADICVAAQVTGAGFFKVDVAPYPTVMRVATRCMEIPAFAKAHPLKQPGAPASLSH
jgi:maleylacetoacetate isomerase